MADLQKHDPIVEAVAKARAAISRRPDIKFPIGNLNIIGAYAYAYSGNITTNLASSQIAMLSFKTGNDIFVGTWTVCGTCPISGGGVSGSGGLDQFHLHFNGKSMQSLRTETDQEDMPSSDTIPITIPPHTVVTIEGISSKNDVSWAFSTALHGRMFEP